MRAVHDWPISWLAAGAAGMIGWTVITAHPRPVEQADPPRLPRAYDGRVLAIADAIAVAEGYYAPGEHDGHSLPFRLNNPGALKKPALDAGNLPTWKDTGIVIFPTREMGWAALHHQVRLMVSGRSRIYEPSDPLSRVGEKYAEGDLNWGINVAAKLGVPPTASVGDVAVSR